MIVEECRNAVRSLPMPARSLPVLPTAPAENPCATAPCRTSDNTRKAACCRDLQVEIMCTRSQHRLEALVRSRRSPYLCKIDREGEYSLDVEMISACGYLEADGVAVRPGPDALVHAQDLKVLNALASGPSLLTRLDGEWW